MRVARPLLGIFLLVGILAGLVALVRPAVPEAVPPLKGVVVDASGLPVVSATVRIKATPTAGITDENGRFCLPCARGSVTASKAGFFIAGVRTPAAEVFLRLKPLP